MNRYATPIEPQTRVAQGRDSYFVENGFSLAGYADRWVKLKVFGVPVKFYNSAARKKVVPFHDLHHVATGYGTDLVGEAEIAMWELRGGCNSLILWALNGSAALFGLLTAPRRTLRALSRAGGQRTLYRDALPYDQLIALTVGELRARLGVPPGGAADQPARLHPDAPGPTAPG